MTLAELEILREKDSRSVQGDRDRYDIEIAVWEDEGGALGPTKNDDEQELPSRNSYPLIK